MDKLKFRFAGLQDVDLYYTWANEPTVRENSYNQDEIRYEDHVNWFKKKLDSDNCRFYVFFDPADEPVGQVRIDEGEEVVIGISIDTKQRGKNYAPQMLTMATDDYLKTNTSAVIVAYIKVSNQASYKSFKNAGFVGDEKVVVAGQESYKLYKKYDERN